MHYFDEVAMAYEEWNQTGYYESLARSDAYLQIEQEKNRMHEIMNGEVK